MSPQPTYSESSASWCAANGRGMSTLGRRLRAGITCTEFRRQQSTVPSQSLRKCLFSSANCPPWPPCQKLTRLTGHSVLPLCSRPRTKNCKGYGNLLNLSVSSIYSFPTCDLSPIKRKSTSAASIQRSYYPALSLSTRLTTLLAKGERFARPFCAG